MVKIRIINLNFLIWKVLWNMPQIHYQSPRAWKRNVYLPLIDWILDGSLVVTLDVRVVAEVPVGKLARREQGRHG